MDTISNNIYYNILRGFAMMASRLKPLYGNSYYCLLYHKWQTFLLWAQLEWFVYCTMTRLKRNSSHGYLHMRRVAENAVRLIIDNTEMHLLDDVLLVAWLHDIDDHKYKHSMQNELRKFISRIKPGRDEHIVRIIERVSRSRERALKDTDWDAQISADGGIHVRNIVSDADKLEALGRKGLKRIVDTTREICTYYTEADIAHHVLGIANPIAEEYLLLFRTPNGKMLAVDKHQQFSNSLKAYERKHLKKSAKQSQTGGDRLPVPRPHDANEYL